jgi:hypothetical protein
MYVSIVRADIAAYVLHGRDRLQQTFKVVPMQVYVRHTTVACWLVRAALMLGALLRAVLCVCCVCVLLAFCEIS